MRNRNFVMVVVGQIISLFGNAILRFALPLYLLSETGSAALFGIVSACAFIPMIVLAPVGGIFVRESFWLILYSYGNRCAAGISNEKALCQIS